MNWYLAKLVYHIVCGDGNHTAQFDEQLRLIRAENSGDAYARSRDVGLREEDAFYNHNQQLVRWEFIDVAELFRLSDLIDGAELYSKINEADDAEQYIECVHRKAASIRSRESHQLLNLI
jgi:Domain of unknown function (DUF4288)